MGEAKQKRSATAKLIAQFPLCGLCGERPSTTRDHIPPKALFDNSLRPDRLVVPACDVCNHTTSNADLIASVICRWNYHSSQQEMQDHSRLVARLRNQFPAVITEWKHYERNDREKARAHLLKNGVYVPPDAGLASIGPITIRHLNLFAYKVTLGIYFEHFRKHLPRRGLFTAIWRTKEDFRNSGPPPKLLELLPQYATLQQGRWNTREHFEYRFDLNKADGIIGYVARFRTSLYVTGFAIENGDVLPDDHRTIDWIKSSDLLEILNRHEFGRRLQ